jgi:uncharacterized protein (DUF2147 family)
MNQTRASRPAALSFAALPTAGLLAAILLTTATAAVSAGSPVGVWLTPEDHGQVRVYACGPALCGQVVTSDALKADPALKDARNKTVALRGRPLKDLPLMNGFKGGPDIWTGGKIYRPQDGGTYGGKIELMADGRLKVTGCLAPGLCQSQIWTRVK